MKFTKKAKQILSIIITGGILFSGCGILPKEEQTLAPPLVKPKKQEYEVYDVKKKDITREIKGNGTLISMNEKNLFTKENGRRIKDIKVQFGQTVKKGDILVELDSDNLENDIKLQQYNLEKAQINYEKAAKENDEYNKKLVSIDVQIEKAKLNELKSELYKSKLIAPVSGKVTFLENLKGGDTVEPYQTLVTIADPNKLEVAYQSGSDVSNVKSGMKASLNYSGKNYEGVVAKLPTSGKYKNSVIINFKNSFNDGKLDDSIEITITLETKKSTIVVPKEAIKSFAGDNTVEVLDGDKKVSVSIEKGIETSTEVEILSGLKEGQKVILN